MSASARPTGIAKAAPFPERLGKYRILLPIGFGGMSTVYLAELLGPAGFRREVALKWVSASVPGFADLAAHLLREARIVGQIRHPHVVQMVDAGEDAEGIYLVMEYVEGGTLAALTAHAERAGKPLPLAIALRIITDALAGLHAAHELADDQRRQLELVHRDFSPQNILVGVEGDVKLGDFGIAKVEHTNHRTRTGIVKGTVSYMSPEQVRGQPLDRRSDLWSAGVVAWELFAGKPFHGKREAIAAAMSTLTGRIPRLRSVRPELPEALDDAVSLALTRTPSRRCQTAAELRERLLATAAVPPASTEEVAAYARLAFAGELLERRQRVEQGVLEPQPGLDFSLVNGAPSAVPSPESSAASGSKKGRGRLALVAALALLSALAVAALLYRAAQSRALPESRPAAATAAQAAAPTAENPPPFAPAKPELVPAPSNEPRQKPASPAAAHGPRSSVPPALDSGLVRPHPLPATKASVTEPSAPPLADNPYVKSRPGSR